MVRAWCAPLLLHAVSLCAVLVAFLAITGPRVAFFSDEGAAIIAARQLEATGSWVEPNPLPVIDPQGQARTIPNADVGTLGRAPYAKHPLYPRLLQLVERSIGSTGFVVLGILGTVCAALLGGLLAEMLAAGTARATLWLVGLASPLLFDSYLVIAHTLGAACAALAVLAAIRSVRSQRFAVAWSVAVGLAIALLVALRTEGALFGLGIGSIMLVAGLWPSRRARWARWPALTSGALAVCAVVGVRAVEARLLASNVGQVMANPNPADPTPAQNVLQRVAHGFGQTVLSPGYQLHSSAAVLVGLAAGLVLLAGVASRGGRRSDVVKILLLAATVLLVLRLAMGMPSAIPGLLVVFPAGLFALALARRGAIGSDDGALVLGTLVLFIAAVAATQYAKGGGIEWGGRYYALAMPLAGALTVVVLHRHFGGRADDGRIAVVGLLCVVSLMSGVLALATLRHTHQATASLGRELIEAGHEVSGSGAVPAGGLPIVLTAERFVPQIEWIHYSRFLWLAPDTSLLGTFARRLNAGGVSDVILVTADPVSALAAVSPDYVAARRLTVPGVPGLQVVILRAAS